MAFDYKKEYRKLYQPPRRPTLIEVPAMRFVAVEGTGDPNEEGGAYSLALKALYGVSYTLKMSKKGSHTIDGYFDYVVAPLEGFWWQEGVAGIDYAHKENFSWISCIRLPEFVRADDLAWAKEEATRKKGVDCSGVYLMELCEGLCVQCMHVGPYDLEIATVEAMERFLASEGYVTDFTDERRHHEIYLSDPRRSAPEKMRTVVRHPIRPA